MPNYTPNLNLIKPLGSENFSVSHANGNADKIDGSFGDIVDQLEKTEEQLNDIVILIDNSMGREEIQTKLNNGKSFKFLSGIYELDFSNVSTSPVCLDIPSNTKIEMESEVILRCIANSYENYAILNIDNKLNIEIFGGKIEGDRDTHSGSSGEWGHGIKISRSRNVKINNIEVSNCWGDGLYIGTTGDGASSAPCENIELIKVKSSNNRRQGLSVTHCINSVIDNCSFIGTNGTSPQAGIDLEPNENSRIENVVIKNTDISGNNGDGLLLSIRNGLTSAIIENIFIAENNIKANGSRGINISKVNGLVEIKNNKVFNNSGAGILIGSTSGCQVQGNNVSGNGGIGIAISTESNDNAIEFNAVIENIQSGINILTSNRNAIRGNRINRNRLHGINCITNSNDNDITNNTIHGNGTSANNTYDNIKIESNSTNNNVQGNSCRKGNNLNKSRYGINIASTSSSNNIVSSNDCYDGGETNGIISVPSTTKYGAGNKNKDGTWSVTPN